MSTETDQEVWDVPNFGYLFALTKSNIIMVLAEFLTEEGAQRLFDNTDIVGQAYWILADIRAPGAFLYIWHGTELDKPVIATREEVLLSLDFNTACLYRIEEALAFASNRWDSWAAARAPVGEA